MTRNRDTEAGLNEAYWISPEGNILTVNTSHIDMVFDNPELFGLTLQLIHSIYNIYNEKFRIEGKAREEILLMLFTQGWIRGRRYLQPYRWSVNVCSVDENTSPDLKKFGQALLEKGHSIHDEVILDTSEGKKLCTLADLANL